MRWRILAGQALPRLDPKVPYNGTAGVPIRGEIVPRGGDYAVLTRNLCGAPCLNTPNVLFADVDFNTPLARRWVLVAHGILWRPRRSLGPPVASHCRLRCPGAIPISAWGGFPVATAVRRLLLLLAGVPAPAAPRRIGRFAAGHPDFALRVYLTPAGYRVLATLRPSPP